MKAFVSLAAALGLAASPVAAAGAPKVCAECVKANLEKLVGPELRGRACGTADETAAAAFIAERLKAYKVPGGAPGGAHLQRLEIRSPTYASPPVLEAGNLRLSQGRGMVALDPPETLSAPLVLMGEGEPPGGAAGKIALVDGPLEPAKAALLLRAGAVAVAGLAPPQIVAAWDQLAERQPRGATIVGVEAPPAGPAPRATVFLRPEALAALRPLAGTSVRLSAPRGQPLSRTSHNVLGVVRGTAPDADSQAILLSAHYDHVGIRGGVLYPGANDDASGTVAVMEFARLLAGEKPPKRTVHFALFGCEEEGGHGAKYFLAHPPTPLGTLAANLEFEMIGLPDPANPKTLMLTGWERSNLGPTLKARGADIGPDKYPQQNFFQRSDNYQLALKGVVAQTISAWPAPPTYHQPTDTVANLDLGFMVEVIQSLAAPIGWLANSDFRPEWNPGMKP